MAARRSKPVDKPKDAPATEDPATRRVSDVALATSVPDDNHQLMQMIRLVLGQKGWIQVVGAFTSSIIMLVWVVAKWGVPAILAGSQLILQLHGDAVKERDADRGVSQQQLKATQDIADGVKSLGTKIDSQGKKLDDQGVKLTQLGVDVDQLKQHQAAADQRLGKLSDVQAAQARALRDRKP